MEDDSQVDYMTTDIGTDTTMTWICDSVKDRGTDLSSRARISSTLGKASASVEDKSSTVENKMPQVCPCGWQKVTSVKGLRTHQGKKKCVAKKGQSSRIDQYFLRSQSSQSDEVQRQGENHSSQDISNAVTQEEEEDGVVREDAGDTEASMPVRERTMEQKVRVRWQMTVKNGR